MVTMKVASLLFGAVLYGSFVGVLCLPAQRRSNNDLVQMQTGKIRIDVMYESLCPYCQRLVTEQLSHIMKSDLAAYIDLRLYPFGNAVDRGGEIVCQHGPQECHLNKVSACAIRELHNDPAKTMDVLTCIESIKSSPDSEWRTCVARAGNSKAAIQDCVTSPKGAQLMKAVGAYSKTVGYEYVPWIEVDGQHSKQAEENLTEFLCRKMGSKGPHFCAMLSLLDITSELAPHQRCFKHEEPSLGILGNL